jgi:hypothetical protein
MNPDTCQCEDKCEEPKLGCGEGKTWDEGACECVEDCQKPREINKESGECECATVGKCITTQEWNEKTCSCEDKKEEECLPPNVKKKCSGLGLAIGKVGLIDEIGDVGRKKSIVVLRVKRQEEESNAVLIFQQRRKPVYVFLMKSAV